MPRSPSTPARTLQEINYFIKQFSQRCDLECVKLQQRPSQVCTLLSIKHHYVGLQHTHSITHRWPCCGFVLRTFGKQTAGLSLEGSRALGRILKCWRQTLAWFTVLGKITHSAVCVWSLHQATGGNTTPLIRGPAKWARTENQLKSTCTTQTQEVKMKAVRAQTASNKNNLPKQNVKPIEAKNGWCDISEDGSGDYSVLVSELISPPASVHSCVALAG